MHYLDYITIGIALALAVSLIALLSVACRCPPEVRPVLPRRREAAGGHRHLGQRQLTPNLLQMHGDDRPRQGLRPLWRVEPDLERDRDSRQHATQHNDLEHGRCPWPCGPDESELMT
jgi:hypothetical protein